MNIEKEYKKWRTSGEDLADEYISSQHLTEIHIKGCLTSIRREARKFEEKFGENPNYPLYKAKVGEHITGLCFKLLASKNNLEETI